MIYGYGSVAADWAATAVWILAEFSLFHYFVSKIPKRMDEGAGTWAVRFLWWLVLTGLQIGQTTIPFFYNFTFRLILMTLYIKVMNQASFLLAGYATFVFYLVKDICKMMILNVAWPLFGVPLMADPWLNTGSMALCVVMQFGILRQIKRVIRMDEGLCLWWGDMGALFFPAAPYGLIKYLQMGDFAYQRRQDTTTAVVCLMLCICDLIILLQTERLITAQRIKEEAEALRVRTQALEARYSQEQEKIQEIHKIYHDMRHHLTYISSLSDNGKIREYIQSITEDMEPCQVFPSTGNEVIDSVLIRCNTECARLGIRLIPSINGAVFDFMEPKDLLVIFGNALDNAREAAGRMERQEDKEIVVRAVARKNFAVIRVENHFPGQLAFDRTGAMRTTKGEEEEGHGYGIKNIRSAAGKYGGELSIEAEGGRFVLTVVIPKAEKGNSQLQWEPIPTK